MFDVCYLSEYLCFVVYLLSVSLTDGVVYVTNGVIHVTNGATQVAVSDMNQKPSLYKCTFYTYQGRGEYLQGL